MTLKEFTEKYLLPLREMDIKYGHFDLCSHGGGEMYQVIITVTTEEFTHWFYFISEFENRSAPPGQSYFRAAALHEQWLYRASSEETCSHCSFEKSERVRGERRTGTWNEGYRYLVEFLLKYVSGMHAQLEQIAAQLQADTSATPR